MAKAGKAGREEGRVRCRMFEDTEVEEGNLQRRGSQSWSVLG